MWYLFSSSSCLFSFFFCKKTFKLNFQLSKALVEKAADCTSFENFRTRSLSYLFNRRHEKIFLNVRDSFMDGFKLNKTIIKVYMHIASKISVVIQRFSHV